jgi:hypothetical protein
MRNERRDNFNKITEDIDSNPKPFWGYIKSLRKEPPKIPTLEGPNGFACTDRDKAETLSDYFASVFTDEPDLGETDFSECAVQSIANLIMGSRGVYNLLVKLDCKKGPGPDDIYPRILKECAAELAFF